MASDEEAVFALDVSGWLACSSFVPLHFSATRRHSSDYGVSRELVLILSRHGGHLHHFPDGGSIHPNGVLDLITINKSSSFPSSSLSSEISHTKQPPRSSRAIKKSFDTPNCVLLREEGLAYYHICDIFTVIYNQRQLVEEYTPGLLVRACRHVLHSVQGGWL